MKPKKTLVVLANDGQARILENEAHGKGLVENEKLAPALVAETEAERRDRRGRSNAAPGMARHAFDLPRTEQEHDEIEFAKTVVAKAEQRFVDGGFDRVVLVAAPKTLGMLRDHLPKVLKDALVADVPKDLLKKRPDEVVKLLEDTILL